VKLEEIFSQPITLKQIKEIRALSGMGVVQKGSRLSIQPVKKEEWDFILKLAQ
jgi:predicted RNA-binding protein with PUA-like domain